MTRITLPQYAHNWKYNVCLYTTAMYVSSLIMKICTIQLFISEASKSRDKDSWSKGQIYSDDKWSHNTKLS